MQVAARRTVRRGVGGFLAIGLLAGAVFGLAAAAAIGARRTQTAAARLVERAEVPAGTVEVTGDANPENLRWLAERDDVRRVDTFVVGIGRTAGTMDWFTPLAFTEPTATASMPLVAGRMFDPAAPQEIVVSVRTSQRLPVGSTVEFAPYTVEQFRELINSGANSNDQPLGPSISFTVVGVVADLGDMTATRKLAYATPAYAAMLQQQRTTLTSGARVHLRSPDAAAVGQAVNERALALVEEFTYLEWLPNADPLRTADSTARMLVIGLLVFGATTAASCSAALFVVLQRQMAGHADNLRWWQLGVGRSWRTVLTALPYTLSVLASLPAYSVVVLVLSPQFPIGSSRFVEPHPGFELNVAMVASCAVAALSLMSGVIVAAAWVATRLEPQRSVPPLTARRARGTTRSVGWQLARSLPQARRGALAAGIAAVGVVAVSVVAASATRLHREPGRFGVPWDATLETSASVQPVVVGELVADNEIRSVGLSGSIVAAIDGEAVTLHTLVPVDGMFDATILAGRSPADADEIAVGPQLLERLKANIGDTVTVENLRPDGATAHIELRIVASALNATEGSDLYAAEASIPPKVFERLAPGFFFEYVVLRFAPNVDAHRKLAELDARYPASVQDESLPAAPGPIARLGELGPIPTALQAVFALLALSLVAATTAATARRSRRLLAILRTLGYTTAQVRLAHTAMAAGCLMPAVLVGTLGGLTAGNLLWRQVAGSLHVAQDYHVALHLLVAFVAALCVVALAAAHTTGRMGTGIGALRSQTE